MSEQLKKQTGKALVWSFIDKGGQQIIQFIFVMVLARLVSREEFGFVGVLAVFIGIATILQDSGFSSALLRKSKVGQEDLAGVFFFNIAIGAVIYLVLFLCAPLISWYFHDPLFTNLSRILFLALLFNSFGIIQNVILTKKMDFKKNSIITLIAGSIAGLVSVYMAYRSYGVWSLAAQIVLQNFIRSLLLWSVVKWRPSGKVSFGFIKEHFGYGSKLIVNGVMNQICNNIIPIITGKYYTFTDVGLYNQANKLNMIPQSVITDSVKGISLPLLAKIEDDEDRRIKAFRKIVRIGAFVSFPTAMILIVMAKPIIFVVLSEKWLDAAPILQIIAIGGSLYPMFCFMGTMLQYKGKPGLNLKIDSLRNALLILSIVITIRFGIIGLVAGLSVVNIITFFIGYFFLGRVISYKLPEVLSDILPYIAVSVIAFVPIYFLNLVITNYYILLPVQLILGLGAYLMITKLLGSKVLDDCIAMAKGKL